MMSITNIRPKPTRYPIGRHVVPIATPTKSEKVGKYYQKCIKVALKKFGIKR
jgi:hypothetical protein